jgi:hypothetical protein
VMTAFGEDVALAEDRVASLAGPSAAMALSGTNLPA